MFWGRGRIFKKERMMFLVWRLKTIYCTECGTVRLTGTSNDANRIRQKSSNTALACWGY